MIKEDLIINKNKDAIYKIVRFWLPVVVWATIIFLFSNRTTIKTVDFFLGDFLLKKTAHIVEYGIFATLLYRAFVNYGMDKKRAMLLSVLTAFLYGTSDEFHQSFIYGRTATVRDVLIDTTGATIFIYGFINNLNRLPNSIKFLYNKLDIDIKSRKVEV